VRSMALATAYGYPDNTNQQHIILCRLLFVAHSRAIQIRLNNILCIAGCCLAIHLAGCNNRDATTRQQLRTAILFASTIYILQNEFFVQHGYFFSTTSDTSRCSFTREDLIKCSDCGGSIVRDVCSNLQSYQPTICSTGTTVDNRELTCKCAVIGWSPDIACSPAHFNIINPDSRWWYLIISVSVPGRPGCITVGSSSESKEIELIDDMCL